MQKHSKLLESVLKYLIAAVFLSVPLYPKFPLIRIPGTFVSIRLEDLLIAFSAILLVVLVIPNAFTFFRDKLNQSIIVFLIVGFVSYMSALLVTKTVFWHIGFLHWARRVQYFIPFFLGVVVIKKIPSSMDFYFKLIPIVIFFVFIYGFGQKYFYWPIIITQNEEYSKGVALRWMPGSHVNSTFAGHYDLATFLVLILPIIVCAILTFKGKRSKVVLITAFFCGLWLLVNTASRISLVSYLIASIFALAMIRKYKEIVVLIAVSIAFMSLSSNLIARYGRLIRVTIDRVKRIELINERDVVKTIYAKQLGGVIDRNVLPSPAPTAVPTFEDRSTNIRLNVEWPRAIRALKKNPLLGTGYSSITLATDNDYLRLLGEVGILGFLAFILIISNLVLKFVKLMPLPETFEGVNLVLLVGVFGALPGLMLNAIFIDIFEASKFAILFWLVVGLSVGLLNNVKDKKHV